MRITLLAAGLAMAVSSVQGAVINFATPIGSTGGGQPVSASATFVTTPGHIQVTLTNLQADPRSVIQCLSGLQFHISTGQTTGTLASSTGVERNIAGNGTFTDLAAAPVGWSLSTIGSDLKLNLLGTPTAPDHTIIGPPDGANVYSNANNSITGGTHSPFIKLSAVFEIDVVGVTAASLINSATFQFNTSAGTVVTGQDVPEPATLTCLAASGAVLLRRRKTNGQG